MKTLTLILGLALLGGAYWYSQQPSAQVLPQAFDASGAPQVWLYTSADCGDPCATLRADLKARGLAFTEKLVDPKQADHPDTRDWRRYGKHHFPLLLVGKVPAVQLPPAELGALLAEHFGPSVLHAREKLVFRRHFNSDGSPRIVMYATDWCGYCARLRKELTDNQIVFTEIDVEKDKDRRLITDTLQIRGVPTTWVGYKRVRGSNLAAIQKVL